MPNEDPKANPISVDDVRLVFLWAEVLPPFVEQKVAAESPLFFLTRGYLYRKAFDRARNAQAVNPKLETPWIPKHQQHFWMRYLVQGNLADVTGNQAWDWQVPQRYSPGVKLTADWFRGRSGVEGFFYPFGIGLAISFQWAPGRALNEFIGQAFQFRRTGEFSMTGGVTPPAALEEVAGRILDSMRDVALGKGSAQGARSSEPFSILTVTQARGVSADIAFKEVPAIHRALEAVTNWRPDWQDAGLGDPATVALPTKGKAPAGSVLYAQERGRAVWFPALFSSGRSTGHLLGCYHRNLMFASLQVESFAQLILYTAARLAHGEHVVDLTAHHRATLRIAAQQLSKMYRGAKADTWRSASIRAHVTKGCLEELKTVLASLEEPALAP